MRRPCISLEGREAAVQAWCLSHWCIAYTVLVGEKLKEGTAEPVARKAPKRHITAARVQAGPLQRGGQRRRRGLRHHLLSALKERAHTSAQLQRYRRQRERRFACEMSQ